MFRCHISEAALTLDEGGNQLDAAVLRRQYSRPFESLGRLLQFEPLEVNETEIGPAGRLPGNEFRDALKRRRGHSALARLSGCHAPVEDGNGLRVSRRRGVGQIGPPACRSAQRQNERSEKLMS